MAEAEYRVYQDPNQRLGARIKDLIRRMTLAEKIGQMTQIERTVASGEVIQQYFIGKFNFSSSYHSFFLLGLYYFDWLLIQK